MIAPGRINAPKAPGGQHCRPVYANSAVYTNIGMGQKATGSLPQRRFGASMGCEVKALVPSPSTEKCYPIAAAAPDILLAKAAILT
ncbi:hypothetical protein [Candidatus Tokpelaia sp.]|uniref:hypothetical protein n=1 Tax=Candidatus Tokpelaia sp. TaxID=2233777 RepID=UPI001239C490|nr:hypothetical protein [Candidatus Tokpelaia sp.]